MEQSEFTQLIRQHIKLIHKVSRAYCRNAEDRNDVAQEIAVQLWRSRDKYDDRFATSTWIYRIALNVAISFYRRERKHSDKRRPNDCLISITDDRSDEPSEEIEILHRCIDDLDELNKALVLLYLDGNDQASMAEILGITVTNVATKLSRIKKKLRSAFEARAQPEQTR